MASGRNDVEFTIGLENDQLKRDLVESKRLIEHFRNEAVDDLEQMMADTNAQVEELVGSVDDLVDAMNRANEPAEDLRSNWRKIGDSISSSAGKIVQFASHIGQAVTAAKRFYDWMIESEKATSGLNAQLERQAVLMGHMDKSRQDRLESEKQGTPQEIQTAIDNETTNVQTLEEQISSLDAKLKTFRDRINSIKDIGGGVIGSAIVAIGGTGELEQMTKDLAEMRERALAGKDAIKELTEAQKEAADKEADTLKGIRDFNSEVARSQSRTEQIGGAAEAIEKQEADRVKAVEDAQKEIDRITGVSSRPKTNAQLAAMEARLNALYGRESAIVGRQSAPLGGFDRGLDAIGDRIADAASKTDENAELERLNEQQVDLQKEIARETTKTAKAMANLKAGMKK